MNNNKKKNKIIKCKRMSAMDTTEAIGEQF